MCKSCKQRKGEDHVHSYWSRSRDFDENGRRTIELWRKEMTPTDMQGKICLVTGSTRCLGKATAFAFAQLLATVILGYRDKQRGEAVLAEIKAASPTAHVDLLLLDLSVQHSVRSAVTEFENRYDHLDVLINNAAVFTRQRTLTADGYETMFATNHLGPFLLTNLLLERLKAAPSVLPRHATCSSPMSSPTDSPAPPSPSMPSTLESSRPLS